MQKTVYEDYKYAMQDVGRLYIGAKYTMGELLDTEDILFKFRMIVERYILPESDREDTLETHLYYLGKESFLVRIYRQLRAKVKVSVIEDRKNLFGKREKRYVTKTFTVDELTELSKAAKEDMGLVIQELSVSKLALAGL